MGHGLTRYRSWLADNDRWHGFEFRPGDIVISTPAKCGTTWMQMICALLVFRTAELPLPLTDLSPWLDLRAAPVADVHAALAAQKHRRFIKTHTPLDGIPVDERVTYVCVGRDPRDAAVSADNHLRHMDRDVLVRACTADGGTGDSGPGPDRGPGSEDPAVRFRHWVEDGKPPQECLELLLHHLTTFWRRRTEPNIVLVHYADLRADLDGGMRRLARRLGIDVDAEVWPGLVAAAGFEPMRRRAARLAPLAGMPGLWRDPGSFFHRGTSGQWRSVVGPGELARYEARVRALVTPDLAAWVQR